MLWICEGCTAAYSVDAPRCPQCGSTEYVEEGTEREAAAAGEPDGGVEVLGGGGDGG